MLGLVKSYYVTRRFEPVRLLGLTGIFFGGIRIHGGILAGNFDMRYTRALQVAKLVWDLINLIITTIFRTVVEMHPIADRNAVEKRGYHIARSFEMRGHHILKPPALSSGRIRMEETELLEKCQLNRPKFPVDVESSRT